MADAVRVLYVDDEPGLLEIVRIFLEEHGGFEVDTAESGAAALGIVQKKRYDAIVSDFLMPGMDGIELLKRIRAAGETIPFILFTGRGREEVVIDAINNGADFYIQKGGAVEAQFAELAHKIRQAVQMRRAQEALVGQEERVHDLQNANDLIQSVAPDGRFLFVNKKWLDTLGYTEKEVADLRLADIISGECLGSCMETFHRVIAGERVGFIDAVFRTRDGRKVYVEGMADCRMSGGVCQYTRGIFKDVTDRKQAEAELVRKNEALKSALEELTAAEEELRLNYNLLATKEQALRESEEKYRILTEETDDVIYLVDLKGIITHINPRITRYGYEPDKVLGHDFSEFIAVDDVPGVVAAFKKAIADRTRAVIELRIRDKASKLHWMEDNGTPVTDASGAVVALSGILRDITHRKAAEAALQESEEKFRALVELSLDGIVITDFTGRLLFANRAAGEIVDAPDYQDLIGNRNVMEFVDRESQVDVRRDFGKVLLGIDTYLVRYKLVTAKKREVWVELIGKKIQFGNASAVLISMRDVTDRRRADEALRQVNKKLNLLSGVTRHDITNQLVSLDGYIALLREKIADPRMNDYFTRIMAASRQIASLIQFTREYELVGVHTPAWQDISTLAESAGRDALHGDIAFQNDLPPGTEIYADPLIAKVFFNLIDNAQRHGGKITTVRFSCTEHGGDLILVCSDDGIGIPVDEKDLIFERGFGKNTGFGLALSREILDITGISIREAGEPDGGARFEIRVPKGQFRVAS